MKSSTSKIVGGLWLVGAALQGGTTYYYGDTFYKTKAEISQLEERMQTPLAEEYSNNLAEKKVVLTEELEKSRDNLVGHFFLTMLSLGMGTYLLREAYKNKKKEQLEEEKYTTKDQQ